MQKRDKTSGRIQSSTSTREIINVIGQNQPCSISDIARLTGFHRETIRKYLMPAYESGQITAKTSGNSVLYMIKETKTGN